MENMMQGQKRQHRFNMADVVLIFIIVAAALILIYIVTGTGLFFGGEEVYILFEIEVPLIRNEFVPAISRIEPGDNIVDAVRGDSLGTVQRVAISEAMVDAEDSIRGIVRRVPHPDHSRVVITVRAAARKDGTAESYLVNGRLVKVGVQMYFRTLHFMGYGTCISLEPITEG